MRILTLAALISVVVFGAGAAVPSRVSWQGVLGGADGKPLTGSVDVAVRYLDAATDPSVLLFSEQFSGISVKDGRFSIPLGGGAPAPGASATFEDVFGANSTVWMEVAAGTDAPMMPRIQLVSVPYAMRAASADELSGLPAAAFLSTSPAPQTKQGPLTVSASSVAPGQAALTVSAVSSPGAALEVRDGGLKVGGAAPAAFIHNVTASNASGSETTIDQPLCNGDPNAILIVTQNLTPGGRYVAHVGVLYAGGRWKIVSAASNPIAFAAGQAFNVLVIKR